MSYQTMSQQFVQGDRQIANASQWREDSVGDGRIGRIANVDLIIAVELPGGASAEVDGLPAFR